MENNLAYQEEVWTELINGRVVAMSPQPALNHSVVAGNISHIFLSYLKGKSCRPLGAGVDLNLSEKDPFLPDGMFICDRDKIKLDGVYGAPDLVVEILSPSTARYDRGYKKDAYEAAGVREYWIIEPDAKSIEVYLLKGGRFELDNVYSVYPDYLLEKMTEEEKAAIVTEFHCSLYEDLSITLEDVFSDTF